MQVHVTCCQALCIALLLVASPAQSQTKLRYKRVKTAVYAVHTKLAVGGEPRDEKEGVLVRIEFLGEVNEDGIKCDSYRLRQLTLTTEAVEYSPGRTVGRTEGGELPILLMGGKQGHPACLLSPWAFFKKPLLFPVLPSGGKAQRVGDKWTSQIPPLLLDTKQIERTMSRDLDVRSIPPEVVSCTWVGNEVVDGRDCAKVVSSLKVASKPEAGEREATASYSITSYFVTDLGLPALTIVRGSGTVTVEQRRQRSFTFFRKSVLVSWEPF